MLVISVLVQNTFVIAEIYKVFFLLQPIPFQ
jgi:hypothetical protein